MSDLPDVRRIPFHDAEGVERTLADYGDDHVFLVVNVASKCGLTPQYEQLEELQRTYGERGLTVVGFPCNQFLGQEPGSMAEILDYCATTWGVSFPIADKVEVNGSRTVPLYKALKKTKDGVGLSGPIAWNFEKFLVLPSGEVRRFRPPVKPDSADIVEAIETALPR